MSIDASDAEPEKPARHRRMPDREGAFAASGAPPAASLRFPKSGRRPVSTLPPARLFLLPGFLLVYMVGAAVAMPFLAGWHWYGSELITDVGTLFCLFVLSLPLIGYWVGFKLLERCTQVSKAAEKIDSRTQGLLDNEAALQDRLRNTLFEDYNKISVGVPIVTAVRSDALRRAMVDRWEPASWLVDAHWSELSSGLPLIATLQRMALQLGILFTFVGLAVAFSSIDLAGANNLPDLKPLMAALQVKFMSSIAGLVASISLLGLGWACRRELARAVARLEAMADNILTLAKTLNNDTKFSSDMTMLRDSVMAVEKRVEGLSQGYREVVGTVKDGIQDLIMARGAFEERLGSVLEIQRQVVAEIDEFYGRLSPQGLSEHLATVLNESMSTFSQRLSGTAEALAAMKEAVDRLASAERVRANDDMGAADRHKELVNAIRQLSLRPPWETSGGGKGGSRK